MTGRHSFNSVLLCFGAKKIRAFFCKDALPLCGKSYWWAKAAKGEKIPHEFLLPLGQGEINWIL